MQPESLVAARVDDRADSRLADSPTTVTTVYRKAIGGAGGPRRPSDLEGWPPIAGSGVDDYSVLARDRFLP
jgi:hypothetical protein